MNPKERQGDRKRREALEKKNESNMNILASAGKTGNEPNGGELFTVTGKSKGEIWRKIEAAVDSGAVDVVGNPRDFPGIDVQDTKESRGQDSWISANGDEIPKLGAMDVDFETEGGRKMRMKVKAGAVSKTLISVSRLMEAGYETNLSRRPYLKNVKTGGRIP